MVSLFTMYPKKVRFESPNKVSSSNSFSEECLSPRPFLVEKSKTHSTDLCYKYPWSNSPTSEIDVEQYFDKSNSVPCNNAQKNTFENHFAMKHKILPSSELEISILDSIDTDKENFAVKNSYGLNSTKQCSVLSRNPKENSMKLLSRGDSFFLKPNSLSSNLKTEDFLMESNKILNGNWSPPYTSNRVNLPKISPIKVTSPVVNYKSLETCMCQPIVKSKEHYGSKGHCCQVALHDFIWKMSPDVTPCMNKCSDRSNAKVSNTACKAGNSDCCNNNCELGKVEYSVNNVVCECNKCNYVQCTHSRENDAVRQKRQMIEAFEKTKLSDQCVDLEKSSTAVKVKREPTVSDLIKIIKLQNEQLQLLQEKVEKLIPSEKPPVLMNKKIIDEQAAAETDQSKQKISIGVMTSFEVVRTSTYINKANLKNQNAQIQCNRSEVSYKEVITRSQMVTENFLEGLTPHDNLDGKNVTVANQNALQSSQEYSPTLEAVNNDKTLNDLSLCNLHIENATTPQLSPDQTLYLDVRDYSDSESENQSNVGWTYYNKVMTHVNCMLDDSEMPSSASALYRNANRKVQMQINKSDYSITKRVKFGDDPLGLITQQHQQFPHMYQQLQPPTETSMKMNALAAKYLKTPMHQPVYQQPVTKTAPTVDMSFATKRYMEKHQLLPGVPSTSKKPLDEMPRFLDITTLKRQPKLL